MKKIVVILKRILALPIIIVLFILGILYAILTFISLVILVIVIAVEWIIVGDIEFSVEIFGYITDKIPDYFSTKFVKFFDWCKY